MGGPAHAKEQQGSISSGADPLGNTISLFLVQVVIIVFTTRVLSAALSYLNQPRVIAEVLAGILLGPSVLGYIPGWIDTLFPQESLPFLTLIANVGLILYMFLVGLELEPDTLLRNARHTVAISVTGIVVPFALGALGSFHLYKHRQEDPAHPVPFASFLLFTGLALSITAFPVLARILSDLNLVNTDVGLMTIGAAAIDDAVAWCMLILVISILNSADLVTAVYVFAVVLGYGLFLLLFARPVISRCLERVAAIGSDSVHKSALAVTFVAIFVSAFFTEIIGVHTIFGAFLLGLAVPSHNRTALQLANVIEDFVSIVMLPLYFAASGLRTQIATVADAQSFSLLLMVLVIATSGKFLGCALAARAVKCKWREAFAIGTLMNTRGLVELIVLNLGLDARVIDVQLFTIMVLMALLTTFATSPLVSLIYPPKHRKFALKEAAAAARRAPPEGAMAATPREEEGGAVSLELPPGFRLLLVAQRTDDVPGVALLTELIRPDELSAVRFVESEETSISMIMAQRSISAEQLDPTLQMVSTFGYLLGVAVEVQLKVCKSEEFARELCKKAVDESSDLVLVPCRKQVKYVGDYHQRFVSDLIEGCRKTLLLFWDHHLGPQLLHRRAVGAAKRVVVLFQGGPHDREVLRITLRFARHEDVHLDVFVMQKSRVTTLQDLEAMAYFEAATHQQASKPSQITIHRIPESNFMKQVLEQCKQEPPHLIVLGAPEGPEGMNLDLGGREKRASVLMGAETNFTRAQMLGKLGKSFSRSELGSSLLVVLCPEKRAPAQSSALEALGVFPNGQHAAHQDEVKEV